MSSRVPAPRPRRLRATLVLTAALAGPVLLASPAAAHDRLTGTDPADGATVPSAPSAVTLTMSETPLPLGSQVRVTGPDGVVSTGDVQVVDTAVTQQLTGERPAGSYVVDWRITSSDGHPVSGSFSFTAEAAATTGAPSASPTTTATPTAGPTSAAPAGTSAPTTPAAGAGLSTGTGVLVGVAALLAAAAVVAGVVARSRRRP